MSEQHDTNKIYRKSKSTATTARIHSHTETFIYDEVHQSKAEHKLNIGWSNCDLFWIIRGMVWYATLFWVQARVRRTSQLASQPYMNTIQLMPLIQFALTYLCQYLSLYLTVCVYLLISYLIHFMWCERYAMQSNAAQWHGMRALICLLLWLSVVYNVCVIKHRARDTCWISWINYYMTESHTAWSGWHSRKFYYC